MSSTPSSPVSSSNLPPSSYPNPLTPNEQPPLSHNPPRPHTARHCGHTLHPSATQDSTFCPPCKTARYIKHLRFVLDFLRQNPKPDPLGEFYVRDERYTVALSAYYAKRIAFQRYIADLEVLAEKERAWEGINIEALKGLGHTSARVALKMASRAIVMLGEEGEESKFMLDDVASDDRDEQTPTAKRVKFSEDVRDGAVRHKHCFRRSHWRYVKGRWGAPVGQPWLDTSFFKEVRYGVEAFEKELDAAWENFCPSPDTLRYLGEIEEDGRVVLAWLERQEWERGRSMASASACDVQKQISPGAQQDEIQRPVMKHSEGQLSGQQPLGNTESVQKDELQQPKLEDSEGEQSDQEPLGKSTALTHSVESPPEARLLVAGQRQANTGEPVRTLAYLPVAQLFRSYERHVTSTMWGPAVIKKGLRTREAKPGELRRQKRRSKRTCCCIR